VPVDARPSDDSIAGHRAMLSLTRDLHDLIARWHDADFSRLRGGK
jgi:hypothetical protein